MTTFQDVVNEANEFTTTSIAAADFALRAAISSSAAVAVSQANSFAVNAVAEQALLTDEDIQDAIDAAQAFTTTTSSNLEASMKVCGFL